MGILSQARLQTLGVKPSTQAPWLQTFGVKPSSQAPLFDNLGSYHRAVGAKPEAQRYFDQGLRSVFAFNYDEAKRAFLAGAPEMDWQKSGLYWRFHLLVAYLLDRQHWSVQRLLTESIEQSAVEDAIRAEKP